MTIETRRSFCRFCHAACPIDVDVEVGVEVGTSPAETVVAIRGVPEDPLFEGYTCIKGRQLADQHHHPDRLRSPLRRVGGTLVPVAAEEALDHVAGRIAEIVERCGPRAIASYIGTGAFQNSTSAPVVAAFHQAIGSPSFYTSVTIDQPAHVTSRLRMGVWDAGWHNFRDADVSLAIGYNPVVSSYAPAGGLQGTNPIVALRRAKRRGMKLVVVDPRRSELAAFADIWLPVRPGEDPTLLAGMLRVILTEERHDAEFCREWVDQLDDLAAAVDPFDLATVGDRCGVDPAMVAAAARLFAAGPRGSAGTGTGPNMAPHSTLTEHLALALNAICGRVNREGDRLESPNFLSPGDTRRAQVNAPSDPAPGAPHRVRGLRGLPGEMLTSQLPDEILLPGEGRVRALIVCGGNPAVAFPDQERTVAALRDLELLVVIDHRRTATAELADVVVPPRLPLERADVPNVMDRRFAAPYASYTPPVVRADGDLLSEWEVYAGLARRLGLTLALPGGALALDGTAADDTVLDLAFAGGRLSMAEVRARRFTILEHRAIEVIGPDPATRSRFAVAPPDVIAELAAVAGEGTGVAVLDGFDPDRHRFRLVSRRMKHVLNSLGRELPGLARVGTTNPAFLHPDDLSDLGVDDGDLVEISSPSGSVVGVARASDAVGRGVISMSHAWGGLPADERARSTGVSTSRLSSLASGGDPLNGMAVQSAIPVAVRRWVGPGGAPG